MELDEFVTCTCKGVTGPIFVEPVLVPGLPPNVTPVVPGGALLRYVNGWECDDGTSFITMAIDAKDAIACLGSQVTKKVGFGSDAEYKVVPCEGNETCWPGPCPF